MNYLAHIFLSGDHLDRQLGGFLGDFVKGPLDGESLQAWRECWPDELFQGIRLHRRLDAFVDAWSPYQECVELLGADYRRWGGVAMDVFFDHLLARHWGRYSDVYLPDYSAAFYQWCEQRQELMPERARQFIARARVNDLWVGYGDVNIFLPVLERIDQRVRFETNLVETGEQVLSHYCELETRFLALLPELLRKSEAWC